MMKSLLCIAVLTGIPVLGMGQSKTDSLRHLLSLSEKNRAQPQVSRHLADLGWYFVNDKQYDSAIHYYGRALHEGDHMADDLLRASAFNSVGVAYAAIGMPDSSIIYYDQALLLYNHMQDTANALTIEANLSIIYKNRGLYEKSLETSFSALSKLEKQKPSRALASCYNTLGVVYGKIGDYQSALTYYYKSLGVRQEIAYDRGIGQSYNNIGEAYIGLAKYDSALANFLRALDVKRRTSDDASAATTLGNIGVTLLRLRKPAQAEPYLREALTLKKEAGDPEGAAFILNNLAELKIAMHQLSSAEACLLEAETYIQSAGALYEQKKNLELKVTLYKLLHDYSHAFQYSEMLVQVKDSLLNREKAESLQAMQVRYETEKKEQQIVLLEQSNRVRQAEIETKQFWIYGLIVAVLLVAVIGTLVYNKFRTARDHRRQLEMLWRELNHRVKNNLQILSSIFTLQVQQQTDETVLQAMKGGEGRVNAMALIHKKLYSDSESLEIKIKEYINELVRYLVHSYGFDEKRLQLSVQVEEIRLDVDKVIRIGLIVNELVSNALKYAYTRQESPRLEVRIAREEKIIQVEVRDNGGGVPEPFDVELAQSFGLRMIRAFTHELRGKLVVQNQQGARFMLNIPI